MLKLHITTSKKIGQPDYGSLGACVALEVELDSGLATNPDALMAKARSLFDLARRAVDAELQNGRGTPAATSTGSTNGNGYNNPAPQRNGGRTATDSQLRAIRAIAKRLGVQPEDAAMELHNTGLDEMTLPQASQLIDHLKSQQTGGVR